MLWKVWSSRALTGLLVSRGVWARTGCGKLQVQRGFFRRGIGGDEPGAEGCVCKMCVQWCWEVPAASPCLSEREKPKHCEAAGETGGKQSPDEFRGKGIPGRTPSSLSEPYHTEYSELDPRGSWSVQPGALLCAPQAASSGTNAEFSGIKPPASPQADDSAVCSCRERLGTKKTRGAKILNSPFSASSPLPTHLLQEGWFGFPTCLANEVEQLEPMSLLLCWYNR